MPIITAAKIKSSSRFDVLSKHTSTSVKNIINTQKNSKNSIAAETNRI